MIAAEDRPVIWEQSTLIGDKCLRIGKQSFAKNGDGRAQGYRLTCVAGGALVRHTRFFQFQHGKTFRQCAFCYCECFNALLVSRIARRILIYRLSERRPSLSLVISQGSLICHFSQRCSTTDNVSIASCGGNLRHSRASWAIVLTNNSLCARC